MKNVLSTTPKTSNVYDHLYEIEATQVIIMLCPHAGLLILVGQCCISGPQGLSRLCVQRVIWTPRKLFFDSLDTQIFMSEFANDDFSQKIEDVEAVVSLL